MLRNLSLRSRLVLGVLALATVGLIAADLATYTSLRSFLIDRTDASLQAAHQEVTALLDQLGWQNAKRLTSLSPAYRSLVVGVAALRRLGYDFGTELLTPYAELMYRTAVQDLDNMEAHSSQQEEQIEFAILGAILNEPVLQALHRLAQEEETTRRYGFE